MSFQDATNNNQVAKLPRTTDNTDNLSAAHAHALATASKPGHVVNHELQPYDIAQLSSEDIVQLHSHRAFSHLSQTEMLAIIKRYGPDHAAHLGDQIRANRTAMAKRGLDVSKMPLWLPITDPSDLNPLTTVFSLEHELPFESTTLPVMYEHIQDIMKREGSHMELIMLALPYLPMPVVTGLLPHVLFQKMFPPAMNSFMWIRHLLSVIRMCESDSTMLDEEVLQRIREEHESRWACVDQAFERETEALLKKHIAESGGGAAATEQVSDSNLAALESLCCKFQLNFIRALERTACSFYECCNQPKSRMVFRTADDMNNGADGRVVQRATSGSDGIPPEYLGVQWCSMLMLPMDKVREDVRTEMIQEITGVLAARDKMQWGRNTEDSEWTYVQENPELTPVTHYASLAQLRHHWQHVFCDVPLSEYHWYKTEKDLYETALVASRSISAGETTIDGQLICARQQNNGDDDIPALVGCGISDLPTGNLMEVDA